jgi:hypothetical protein
MQRFCADVNSPYKWKCWTNFNEGLKFGLHKDQKGARAIKYPLRICSKGAILCWVISSLKDQIRVSWLLPHFLHGWPMWAQFSVVYTIPKIFIIRGFLERVFREGQRNVEDFFRGSQRKPRYLNQERRYHYNVFFFLFFRFFVPYLILNRDKKKQ